MSPVMKDRTLLRTGIIGSVIAALCCSTPVLALVFGALGVSAWLVWADYVVLPALIVFLALTGYALFRARQRHG
jgi:mercuric ion transport protein